MGPLGFVLNNNIASYFMQGSLLKHIYHMARRTRQIARRTGHYYSLFGLSATICRIPLAIHDRLRRGYLTSLSETNNENLHYRMPQKPVDLEKRLALGVQRLAVVATVNDFAVLKISHPDLCPDPVLQYGSAALARRGLENKEYDCLLLCGVSYNSEFVELLREAKKRYVPSIYWLAPDRVFGCSPEAGSPLEVTDMHWQPPTEVVELIRANDFVFCSTGKLYDLASRESTWPLALNIDAMNEQPQRGAIWQRMLSEYRRLHFPKVSIVTILYDKALEIESVLESYSRQTYEGAIEFIFVDDKSPDHSAAIVGEYMKQVQQAAVPPGRIECKILRNDRNRGNCISRNVGIAEATGDIVVVVDADCLLNGDFILRHVEAHAFGDCDIAVGPLNIETNGAEPMQALRYYEERLSLALARAELQDPINRTSFLNCVTRNFSIKSKAIEEELFDPRFTYSADPESGYGWEDIEMGYRLYQRGLRIKFVEEAFAIHVTPVRADNSGGKCLRSIKNFRRLYEKHPELGWIARRWSFETFEKIREWADKTDAQTNDDRRFLDKYFQELNGPPTIRLMKNRYRVLSYRWHVPHQYELYKLPIDVTLVTGLGAPMTDGWEYSQRPLPFNARFARAEDIDTRHYDLAILHFDENVLAHGNTNGVIGPDWGAAFTWMRDNIDIPKVAICHGTPQFYGQYNIESSGPDLLKVIEVERARLVDYLGNIPVVLNSHQAQREWRFRNSRVIWHGFDPTEFLPATYERGILSPLGPLVMSRPHYRGYFLYKQVFNDFPAGLGPESLHVPEPHVLYSGNVYAIAKYQNYIDEIRRYSVYFNPTQRSPMPRARCEPMMCGVVTVSAQNHDVDMFIRNGVNGFYANDPKDLRQILIDLAGNPGAVRQIGAEARKTAIDIFNHDRYLADWRKVFSDTAG